jgi:hypothetical protein
MILRIGRRAKEAQASPQISAVCRKEIPMGFRAQLILLSVDEFNGDLSCVDTIDLGLFPSRRAAEDVGIQKAFRINMFETDRLRNRGADLAQCNVFRNA